MNNSKILKIINQYGGNSMININYIEDMIEKEDSTSNDNTSEYLSDLMDVLSSSNSEGGKGKSGKGSKGSKGKQGKQGKQGKHFYQRPAFVSAVSVVSFKGDIGKEFSPTE